MARFVFVWNWLLITHPTADCAARMPGGHCGIQPGVEPGNGNRKMGMGMFTLVNVLNINELLTCVVLAIMSAAAMR